ncbi:MAG: hypothetical protein KBB54_00335 [Candidatus Pacebacteria bacterium]|nr:hypothetical protein [Candidatus Paceibacterota bacterium]MBP9818438.1 hypothetical protein [Candidatus Paceibacterota bacterium]
MLHLLTEEHRQKVVREYRKRVLVLFCLGLFFVSIAGAVCILPTFFTSYGRYSDFQNKKQALELELSTKEDVSSSESVRSIALSIQTLKMFDEKKIVSPLIEDIINGKPEGVRLKNMIFTSGEGSAMTIDIAGRASTRKSLVTLNQQLKAVTSFESVSIPLGSFAKEKDIDFSIKIVVKEKYEKQN